MHLSRAQWIGSGLVTLAMGVGGLWPPMAEPSYEAALVAGLLLPTIVAVVVSVDVIRRRSSPFAAFCRGVATGVWLALLAYLVLLLHGLRVGFCDLEAGTELFALGPAAGAVLAGVWGAAAGSVAVAVGHRRRRSVAAWLLALAGPWGSLLLHLLQFYRTPMVFAYDPFVGYFSGAVYDTVLDPASLYTYRVASAATLLACYVAALHLERADDANARRAWLGLRARSLGRPGLLAVGLLAALGSVASVVQGDELGHWQTSESIAETLGAEQHHGRCRLVYAASIRRREAQLLVEDCDAHLEVVSSWLGSHDSAPVTVFLFADASQKRRLMGAASTSIAKPWRREVYLQHTGYPHRSLGHELVHVLAGEFGRGPFRIAGRLGGWLPDPGLIEGIAVAGAPPRGNLSPQEWAQAMRIIEVLPPVDELFGLSFFSQHSRTAYTAAGAFVAYVRQRFGPQLLQRWYAGEDLEQLCGQSVSSLERDWHAELAQIQLSEAALEQARARFDRPGVFARRCPHVVDAQLLAAGYLWAIGDVAAAKRAYDRAVELDPANTRGVLGRAGCLSRLGKAGAATRELRRLVDAPGLPRGTHQGAVERLGDLALRAGSLAEARRWYTQAQLQTVDEGRLRTLDVKLHACEDPRARPTVLALLVGADAEGPNNLEALDQIGRWRAQAPDDGIPDYLLARQYLNQGSYARAARRLDEALDKTLAIERVRTEALRLRLVVACALGDTREAQSALERYVDRPALPPTRRAAAEALLDRCTRGH